jgi:coenzyme F420-reducing hydrogenase delta subunit
LLDQIGLGGERVQMFNLSSAMGTRFAEVVVEMTEKLRRIGKSPLKEAGKQVDV